MVAGSREAVDRLVAWAQHGPPAAVVEGVDVQPGDGVFDSFEQRPSA
jgi:acylphosphatase